MIDSNTFKKTNLYKCCHKIRNVKYEKLCKQKLLSRVYNFYRNWPFYESQILIRESSNKFNKMYPI